MLLRVCNPFTPFSVALMQKCTTMDRLMRISEKKQNKDCQRGLKLNSQYYHEEKTF